MHEAGYKALGLDFRYASVESQDLGATVAAFLELDFKGFAVSMPYKRDIIAYLDETSADVAAIGACNTVVNKAGRLTGHNTDWRGALDALRECGVHQPGRAIVLGAGGAARALVFGLKSAGWQVEVAARNHHAGVSLASDFGLSPPQSLETQSFLGFDLVVNTTPVSTLSDDLLNLDHFPDARAVFDVVFNPVYTPLCAEAERRGLVPVPGWLMLLHQALHQFTLYTGVEAPAPAMREALLKTLA
ncbi:shikimate dehydrogenase [Bradyrhizobium sp. SSUT18]|uniref:shikimate dehydrogenase family protein n=1 Tax=Bradyrhizobium sp. SSUT18 TaxID=3040602 RepID=UPI002447A752|nr:shikimate dehydrogenase [Bradyrhizobium sp. SSUT18]MDH2406630.1 shikimate dehydrogenase [Bradyrhizobium sp. SSUT18]